MGCGSSQAVSVINTEPINQSINNKTSQDNNTNTNTKIIIDTKPPPIPHRLAPLPNIARYDSGISSKVDSNSTNESDTNISRRSSAASADSASAEFCLEGEYKSVITEKSKKNLIEKIEKDFVEKSNLELSVNGKGCPVLLSDKEKEKASQDLLKSSGLVLKPILQKPNSAHFEIKPIESMIENKTNLNSSRLAAPPPRLARERTKIITAQDIEQKLEKANQRKQQQILLKTSMSIDRRAANGDESFADSLSRQPSASMRPQSAVSRQLSANRPKSSSIRQLSANSDEVLERQKKLREIRDKLKAKTTGSANGEERQMTPRSKEIVDEFDVFRPKTPAAFRPEY